MFLATLCLAVIGQTPSPPTDQAADELSTPATVHAFLLAHDQDRDGLLTFVELPEKYRSRFDRADVNGDGKLDARELLTGSTRISREARRAERLKMTRDGLKKRTGPLTAAEPVDFRVQRELLERLDHNNDGFADGRELASLLNQTGVLFGDRPYSMTSEDALALSEQRHGGAVSSPFLPDSSADLHAQVGAGGSSNLVPPSTGPAMPNPFDPMLVPGLRELPVRPDAGDVMESLPDHAIAVAETKQEEPSAPSNTGSGGGLPDAESILLHLDKNGNGQLDRSEAVDQLADNFDKLDRDRDNMLSDKEIKRGLFLARMLGIKPKRDPNTYRSE